MLTIILSYYNEPHYLDWWYHKLMWLHHQRPGKVKMIIVDDGSTIEPAIRHLKHRNTELISLYAVVEDIGFNNHGARNLAMKHTTTSWNLLTDIDRRYTDETMLDIIDNVTSNQLDPMSYYRFSPARPEWPHTVNDYVIHRETFWQTGGYDEEFANIHWGDRLFFECLDTIATPKIKVDWVVKYTRAARNVDYQDVAKTTYPDDTNLIHPMIWKNNRWREGVIAYVSERNKVPLLRKRKPIFNFPWVRVL